MNVAAGGDLDETRALVDGVRSEPWFASANLPSSTSSGDQWRRIMDFDVRPALRRLNLPILLGILDIKLPQSARSEQMFQRSVVYAGRNTCGVAGRGLSVILAIIVEHSVTAFEKGTAMTVVNLRSAVRRHDFAWILAASNAFRETSCMFCTIASSR